MRKSDKILTYEDFFKVGEFGEYNTSYPVNTTFFYVFEMIARFA